MAAWFWKRGRTTNQAWAGHGAPGHDKVLGAGAALVRVEMELHWGFPRALLRVILIVFSLQRRVG